MKRAWALILIGTAGCVDLEAPYPDRRFYTIDAPRTGAPRTGDAKILLRVRRFSASRMCDGSELVTRTGEATYESDFYNVLFVPPALQIGEQTQRWLAESGLYGHVVGPGSSLAETHLLEGHLVALYGDYRKPGAQQAVTELQFMLARVTEDPAVVLLQKTYREEIPLANREPASLVKGWSEGLSRILAALEEDLATVKEDRPSSPAVR
jgi:hypothetical protein